jgi:hypothetical protein
MTTEQEQRKNATAAQSRSNQAEELLNNPLYIEAVTVMRAAMYGEFEDTKLADVNSRHELWQRMQLMKGFQNYFEKIVKEGKKGTQTIKFLDDQPNNQNL